MGKNKKILIIEDEETLRKAVKDKLEIASFSTVTCSDSVVGLETALRDHPDLILLDIVMPKMSGLDILKELRKDVWGKTAEVIMFTNLSDDQSMDEAKRLGVRDYWVKSSLRLDDILTMVKSTLGI
ncbi:MAG: response regulator [Candidatus Taylorbacteria bacterium]